MLLVFSQNKAELFLFDAAQFSSEQSPQTRNSKK